MPVVQLPAIRMQVSAQVSGRSNARDMAQEGFIDVVGAKPVTILLNISAASIHPTMCASPIGPDQLVLSQDGAITFEFPTKTYEIHDKPHLGLAITLYINRSADSIQHSVATIAYVNFDKVMSGCCQPVSATLNDVHKTPVSIVFQSLITPQQALWNVQNAPMLHDLTSKFNSINRIEERLFYFSEERSSALTNFLDPHNKDNVHATLAMPTNAVRHVMNVDTADNAQTEFFKQVCCEECPDFLLKYAPLSAAMLLTTAVKFLSKDNTTSPVSYKSIADRLTNMRWTEQDAELWMQIFCNCVTSIVPACNTYTGDASWLVNSDGVRVIPNLVGEEQMLLGSPLVQAVHDINACQQLSGMCTEMFSGGDLQRSELAFRAAHEARLKTSELGKKQDCEDFAADMRNYLSASTHAYVMETTAMQMIGTPLLCSDARLNLMHNTIHDAQQALLLCCATQRHIHELIKYTCQDCICIAAGANLTSKYCASLDAPSTPQLDRAAFPDRDMYILRNTPGASGHCCRIRTKSTKMHSFELRNDVKVHAHAIDVFCIQESTSSTILRETTEPADVFDVRVQVGLGNTRQLSGMKRSMVRNITGSIYSDMLTNSGLSASHAADRMGTKEFYKVLSAVGGHSMLSAEKSSATLQPAQILDSMLRGCSETHYYFGAENTEGAQMMSLQFELKDEEKDLLRLLARAHAPLYTKSMPLILASGDLGTCFFPRLDGICGHMPTNAENANGGKQLFVVAQKSPLLCMTDVLKSNSVDSLLDTQKARVCGVLRQTCKSQFDFYSDHISTDIMLLHTHISM